MLGVDSEIAASAVRLWIAAGSAALLVVVCGIAFARAGAAKTNSVARSAIVVIGAVLGAAIAWAVLGSASDRDHSAERRALDVRAQELTLRALAPGSPLACLDGLAGDTVEAACERAIFATPVSVAAAISYVAARLVLLSDMAAYARLRGANLDSMLRPLEQALEADRFGLLAHALAERDGCTREHCQALTVLHDARRVRANLSDDTLDRYLERYATIWTQAPDRLVAEAAEPAAAAPLSARGPRKVTVNIDFPSAASIPPVSIMNPEPKGPVPPAATAAAAAANPQPPAVLSPHRLRKQAANPPAQPAAAPPAAAAEPVDPVWMPAAAAPATQAAATAAPPAANAASNGAAPMQLNPFPSQSAPNPGMTMRAE